jgi:gamma-glutamyltranspeptidase/glutathione hydrolase
VAHLAKSRQSVAIDFDSRAPLAYRPDIFEGLAQPYEQGSLSITVPAVVAGLALALDRFGTKSWSEVSQAAIRLAEHGFPMTPHLKAQLDDWLRKADPISRQALFPGGATPQLDAIWRQPDLAKLLIRLADEGPRAFYEGEIPQKIVRQIRERGGILSEADFRFYQPEVVEPLEIDYRGYRILTPPPPSGGLTSLEILKVLEQFDLSTLEPWGARYFHLFAEAAKLCWQDRLAYFGDPDATPIPVDRLLSNQAAQDKSVRIQKDRTLRFPANVPPSPPHTANIVAADADGNIVSVTATHGYLYGSQVAIDGLGLVMGHGMSRFDLSERSPNAPAPGKRMFHNMSPMILLRARATPSAPDSRPPSPGPTWLPWAAVGLPGGPKIVTVTAQLIASLIDFHATPLAAVWAPRIHIEADEPISVSAAVPEPVIDELRAIGHTVTRGQTVGGQSDEIGGKANAIVIDPTTQDVLAASQAGEATALTIC